MADSIKAILVDDEPNNLENLRLLLNKHCPQVTIMGEAGSAERAREIIDLQTPDLLFLDIQMPGENGFEFLQSLPEINFEVIFVTAYDQYGIQAIKLSALDYLLKPIDTGELKKAVGKAEKHLHAKQQKDLLQNVLQYFNKEKSRQPQKLALSTASETHLVSIPNIIRCESLNTYTTFYLVNGEKIMVSRPIKEYDEMLGDYGFIRTHQSYLVNKVYVQKVLKKDGCTLLLSDGSQIPVSRQKKEQVLSTLNTL